MGGGHSHRADGQGAIDFEVAARPRFVLLVALALAAVVTVVGLIALWPNAAKADALKDSVNYVAPGVTFTDATVDEVLVACEPDAAPDPEHPCGLIRATVESGDGEGKEVEVLVPPEVSRSGLDAGDSIRLTRTPGTDGHSAQFAYFGTERGNALWVLVIAFVLLVVLVARLRGLFALVGLVFSGLVLLKFVLPALLVGEPGPLVGLVGSASIMFVVLYLTHGVSIRTSAALAGTLVGVAITAGIGHLSVGSAHLTGVADETGSLLTTFAGGISFQDLMTCAIIVAGLGVLNDVTITQASAVWELRGAAPDLTRRAVFVSAMRIGRDHIASTIYTIVFAYAGTTLSVLLVLQLYDLPMLDLLATEQIAEEVVRTLAASIGLVLAVPLTTAIAALTVPAGRTEAEIPRALLGVSNL